MIISQLPDLVHIASMLAPIAVFAIAFIIISLIKKK